MNRWSRQERLSPLAIAFAAAFHAVLAGAALQIAGTEGGGGGPEGPALTPEVSLYRPPPQPKAPPRPRQTAPKEASAVVQTVSGQEPESAADPVTVAKRTEPDTAAASETLDLTNMVLGSDAAGKAGGGPGSGGGTGGGHGSGHGTGVGAGTGAGTNHQQPVRLDQPRWNCPWPDQAESSSIREAHAIIRVRVAANGAVEDVRVLEEPGMGFADAAAECAQNARFEPARDRGGHPIAAQSPPIRVRFWR